MPTALPERPGEPRAAYNPASEAERAHYQQGGVAEDAVLQECAERRHEHFTA